MDSIVLNTSDPEKKTICIIAEGSYPYVTGGVSAWIQDIISGLDNYNFILFAITADQDNTVKYDFPPNVVQLENRILTEPVQRPGKRVNNDFFDQITTFHDEIMKNQDFNRLEWIVKTMQKYRYSNISIQKNTRSWEMTKILGNKNNPLYPFSDYYWAWLASHEYMLKILTWDIPVADLYHTISTGYAGLTAAIAKIMFNKPVLLTEHGLYNKEREIDIKRARWVLGYQRDLWVNIFNDLGKITYDYSDLVISLFEMNRNIQISQGAQRDKTMVIPNGIELSRYLDLKIESREKFSVGIVARVVPIKDIKNFIIAAKIVTETIPDSEFFIIGPEDEDMAYYDECIQLVANFKIEKNIIFTGKADVREYYSFLDVLVLSSIREAQPLVILEAYAAGIPVVSTRVGNVPEMLDYDEKLLADPKDSFKLADGIITLYQDDEYRESLVAANREKVIKYYSKTDLIATYDGLYSKHIEDFQTETGVS